MRTIKRGGSWEASKRSDAAGSKGLSVVVVVVVCGVLREGVNCVMFV